MVWTRAGPDHLALPDLDLRADTWEAPHLSVAERRFLTALPNRRVKDVPGLGEMLFCHASPCSDAEFLTSLTAACRFDAARVGVAQQVVVYGHPHVPLDRLVTGVRVLIPGSVGLAYSEAGSHWMMPGVGSCSAGPMMTGSVPQRT